MAAASRVLVAATGAITTIVIARVLGPAGSGTYFLAQSMVLLLTVAVALGVPQGVAYYVSSGAWEARRACRAAVLTALVTGVIGAGLGMIVRLVVPSAFADLSLWMTAVVVAGLPFALIWSYVSSIALAIDSFEAYVIPPAAQSVLALFLALPGSLAFGIEGGIVGLTLSGVLVAVGCVVWAHRRLPPVAGGDEGRQMIRHAIRFGAKGYAAVALQQVNYRLDLFVLSAVASAAAVGQYSVAYAVTAVLLLLPLALSEVVFPRVARLSAHAGADAEAHREMVELKSLRHVTLAVTVMALILAAALAFLVVPVYGQRFRPAIDLGLILLPGVALVGISGVLAATIVGRGRPAYSLYVAIVTTPMTVALYAGLIPWLHATGAALASTVSYAATFGLSCFYYRRLTGRAVLRALVPTRDEARDLIALPGAVVAWARGVRT